MWLPYTAIDQLLLLLKDVQLDSELAKVTCYNAVENNNSHDCGRVKISLVKDHHSLVCNTTWFPESPGLSGVGCFMLLTAHALRCLSLF